MARARNIKPAFFDNDVLALDNDPLGRLLFIGLWTLADCNGNLEWRSARIKARLLPYDECDIEALGKNLDKSGFVRFYSDGEKLYLSIPKFLEHQNPHKNEREKGGEVPEYSDKRRQLVDLQTLTINPDFSGAEPEHSETDHADSPILNPESGSLNEESRNPESGGTDAGASDGGEAPPDDSPASKPPPKSKGKLSQADLKNHYGLPDDLAAQFMAIRKDKRMTLTPKAMDDLVREFGKAGLSVHDGITLCCRRSWAGFKASWNWQDSGGGRPGNSPPGGETPQQRGERMARERGYV